MRVIRPSSLTTAADCPRRWAAHHLSDLIEECGYRLQPSRRIHVGAAVGGAVHAGAAYTMGQKRDTGELGSQAEAIDRAENELVERVQHGVVWDHTTGDLGTAQRQIERMTISYRRELAPKLEPLAVEMRLAADIGDGWEISGQLDTLTGDPDNVLDDLKTGVVRRANAVQYATYAMLFRSHGYAVHGIYEDYLKRVPLKAEQPPPARIQIPLQPAIEDAHELITAIKRDTAEFERRAADLNGLAPNGAFRPNPASMLCGQKWCRAWGTDFCHAHIRG